MKRRDILKGVAVLPAMARSSEMVNLAGKDYFRELGLRTFINAAGNYTSMTASLMPPEVMAAIQDASRKYVMLDEVQDKVGARIAQICRAEAAMVTAGCWSALVLGMAGVLTGNDPQKVPLLPFPAENGLKSEVILQKSHATGYHLALANAGVKFLLIETAAELEKSVSEKTAMLWFLNREDPAGQIHAAEWVSLGKKLGIPTMIDIAADVPPVENLWKFNEMGFDLVCISGGKALLGPQSAGILMGRKELIGAARLSAPPRSGIGRGHKVNKEEIIGMLAALESYVQRDHQRDWNLWEDRIRYIKDSLRDLRGVVLEDILPPIANQTPSLKIGWAPSVIRLTRDEMGQRLRDGNPSIETISWEDPHSIRITVFMLKTGEEKTVARRIREELLKSSV